MRYLKGISKYIRFSIQGFIHILAMNVSNDRLKNALYRCRGTKIGDRVRIAHGVFLEEVQPDLIEIEDGVNIGPRVLIVTHDSSYHCINQEIPVNFERVIIRKNGYIGAKAVILPGIIIGEGSIVAAGAVVTKDVAPGSIVAGIPAKPINTVEEALKRFTDLDVLHKEMGSLKSCSSNLEKKDI